jgi:integrase
MPSETPPEKTALIMAPAAATALDRPGAPSLDAITAPAVGYLAGHPRMLGSLQRVLRALDRPAKPGDVAVFPWERLGAAGYERARSVVAAKYPPATARHAMVAVRGVMRMAWRQGKLDRDTMERTIDGQKIGGDSEPAGRMLSAGEVRAMAEAAATAPRDAALLTVAVYGGLRRAEISDLDLSDVGSSRVIVRHGKGNKRREVALPSAALTAIEAWLKLRGTAPGPLFYSANRGGNFVGARRLSANGVHHALIALGRRANIDPLPTPHDFRRTFASMMLAAGVDLVTVQKRMGHRDPATTAKYDRRAEDAAQRKAADALAAELSKED